MDKIICVGKNYGAHAAEMKEPVPAEPVIFLKPASVLLSGDGGTVSARHPWDRGAVHYECEIVLRLGRGGASVPKEEAWNHVDGVTLGLDMTLRDVQAGLKKGGLPWTTGKVFNHSAIVGSWLSAAEGRRLWNQPFTFALNGAIKQTGLATDMLRDPAALISAISGLFPLCAGDLIFTGTPAGVGPVVAGDRGELRWGSLKHGVSWA
jgi:2-keto-4-pentenoate hydratase/2-oxohepta-3-ene-1,7-dioic acid hydratase in catechol pathway